jgi:S-DNA-T family DNA segregation ATPase FtsK/SpoIIIE
LPRLGRSGERIIAGLILFAVDHCDECGFTYAAVSAQALSHRLESAGDRFAATLATTSDPCRRPAPSVWSPLEYTCHVRDVLRVQGERLALALRNDNPEFAPMGREERVLLEAYNAQDPQTVLAELAEAANDLARAFDALRPEQWSRTGIYPWPNVESRTVLWLGRHTVHEIEHHLMDLTR